MRCTCVIRMTICPLNYVMSVKKYASHQILNLSIPSIRKKCSHRCFSFASPPLPFCTKATLNLNCLDLAPLTNLLLNYARNSTSNSWAPFRTAFPSNVLLLKSNFLTKSLKATHTRFLLLTSHPIPKFLYPSHHLHTKFN